MGLLSLGPMSGYQLRQLIDESIGNFWTESYGQIYPTLRRLAAEGMVTVKTEREKGRAERKVYTLTKAGHNRLRDWLNLPAQQQVPRNDLLPRNLWMACLQLLGHEPRRFANDLNRALNRELEFPIGEVVFE